jgi:UDP-glucuronate 4-epimerase
MKTKKIFITGIAGFIGFHTASKYAQLGYTVCGMDNFNSYYDVQLKRDRVKLLSAMGVSCYEADIRNSFSMDFLIRIERPDLVIHLAAMAGIRYSMDRPEMYIDNNINGTAVLIKACEDNNVSDVIYATTSSLMNGNPLPWNEKDKLGPQLSPYGYTKQTNENQFNISKIPNAVALRFFTVYGPWGRPDMALFDFTKNIIAGNPITLYNYGVMKRDFTYIDDIVQGIVLVSLNMTPRDIYCIGYGEQVNLTDFLKEIENNLNISAIVTFAPKHPADAQETFSDTTKLKTLGYNPTTSISKGITEFIEWYREYYK